MQYSFLASSTPSLFKLLYLPPWCKSVKLMRLEPLIWFVTVLGFLQTEMFPEAIPLLTAVASTRWLLLLTSRSQLPSCGGF